VNAWKAILAALVIFAAGVVTGGLTVRLKIRDVPPRPANNPPGLMMRQRGDLLDRLQRQLYLTPPQRQRIEQILRENHERMKQLWDSIAPQAQEEHKRVHDLIRAELNPDQQKIFEDVMKWRGPSRFNGDRRRGADHTDQKSSRKPDATTPSSPTVKTN
jgi:Spy/CpxP family protein refolding chaperone